MGGASLGTGSAAAAADARTRAKWPKYTTDNAAASGVYDPPSSARSRSTA